MLKSPIFQVCVLFLSFWSVLGGLRAGLILGFILLKSRKKTLLKKLIFEAILTKDLLMEKWQRYRAWDFIEEGLILGRLPLESHGDGKKLSEIADVVISIIEPFEAKTRGLLFSPLEPESFAKYGLVRETIPFPDLTALEIDIVKQGVALIQKYREEGKRVYVHCKSGQGRSACLVAAYLLQKNPYRLSVDEVALKIRQKRPQITLSRQKNVLCQFLETLSH